MPGHSRRQLLQGSAVLAACSLLPSNEVAGQPTEKVPRIGFWPSAPGRAALS